MQNKSSSRLFSKFDHWKFSLTTVWGSRDNALDEDEKRTINKKCKKSCLTTIRLQNWHSVSTNAILCHSFSRVLVLHQLSGENCCAALCDLKFINLLQTHHAKIDAIELYEKKKTKINFKVTGWKKSKTQCFKRLKD